MNTNNPRRRRRAATVLAAALVATSAALPVRASTEGTRVQPIGRSDSLHAESTGVKAFAFYSGAPAAAVEELLPPGFTLGSCLEHRAPVERPVDGTADLLVEVLEHRVAELGDAVIRLAAIATCAHPDPDAGFPEPVAAESPVFAALGRPSAPLLVSLGTWHDSDDEASLDAMNDFVERHGMRPGRADIEIERAVDPSGGWRATVAEEDGTELFSARFPSRFVEGSYVACADYVQEGHLVEWHEGARDLGVVHFTHFVEGRDGDPADDRHPGKLCLLGGEFTWSESSYLGRLAGSGTRVPTVIGQQLEEPGVNDHWEFQRYRWARSVGPAS